MKHCITIILLLFSFCITAQNFEDIWSDYYSYTSVKSISQGNDRVYAASENAIFTYDLSTQEVNTISTVQGLSGDFISTILYSEDNSLLVIGYENGLIEIVIDGEENILTEVGILSELNVPPDRKRINHFNEFDGKLYISAGYGISVYDLVALEFVDTYFIGSTGGLLNVTQTTVQGANIYAATTDGGIRFAVEANDNLINFEEWSTLTAGSFIGIQSLSNELYAVNSNNSVFRSVGGAPFSNVANLNNSVVDFKANNDLLTIVTTNAIRAYSFGFALEASVTSLPDFDFNLLSGHAFDNNFYLGTDSFGMLKVPFGTIMAEQILPDGPLFNSPFTIAASAGQLWVGFGDIKIDFDPFPLTRRGISNYRNGEWNNIPYEDLPTGTNNSGPTDIVEVTIDPNNADRAFFSSFQKGLLVVDGESLALFDQGNSAIPAPIVTPAAEARIFGQDYDRQGNLWFVQSRTDRGLVMRSPQGSFQSTDISSIIDGERELALSSIAISREGSIFFGAVQSGLIAHNPGTDQFVLIEEGAGNGNLPSNNIRALKFDNQNRLWIGTLEGLRVLFNTGGVFEEGANNETQAIIILDDGIPQELLFEQSITDIEVDGSNNKWISTATSGVFYLSANGQETLLRFTKDNSPLPSDNVQDITIDPFSGVVYFATIAGLVSYDGTATAPRDNLEEVYSFPNPVRPGFVGNVTIDGLTANANVKITDIEGNLVFEETSEGGSVLWDTTAFGKYRVASGVYLALISTEDALETKVHKIMIVR